MNSAKFEPEELSRYQRHLVMPELGYEGQVRLKIASVLVIGAGGLGCPALMYMAAAGIGTVGIVDHDIVNLSNLHRQVLYSHEDIGKQKATKAAERLQKINPYTNITAFQEKLTPENVVRILESFQVVVDGTDNMETRYLINDACIVLDKPYIYGSVSRFEGQLSVFNYQDGPTFRCLFPEKTASGSIPSCEMNGVVGTLPGIIGTMQAMEAIKIITDIGEVASGKLITYNALENQIYSFKLEPVSGNRDVRIREHY